MYLCIYVYTQLSLMSKMSWEINFFLTKSKEPSIFIYVCIYVCMYPKSNNEQDVLQGQFF